MAEHELLLVALAGIVILGVAAQWVAWRLALPAILVLLLFGLAAGPLAQWLLGYKLIDPDRMLRDLLYPVVSLSVAVILFEGGLTLNLVELRQVGRVLRNLVTIGALVSWIVITLAAMFILQMPWQLSLLLGAILVVTGPTVILPLLRFVKPVGPVGPILRWEGIVIDPLGAMLALLVYEAIHAERQFGDLAVIVSLSLLKTIVFGTLIGLITAAVLVLVMRRFWVADYLQNPVALGLVVAAFTCSNLLQGESGLLAVTVMGIAMATQRWVPFKHILEFKESLTVLLVSSLFILLGSRLDFAQVSGLGWRIVAFIAVLMVIARPLSVLVSARSSTLSWREQAFLMWMAPRGIVAAAVASVFALRLDEAGYAQADRLVAVTLAVVIATVTVYGLTASSLARRLKLGSHGGGGFLIAGANHVARAVARVLREEGKQVVLVDTNPRHVADARMAGLTAHLGSVLSEQVQEKIDGTGIGQLLAMTPNEEVNALATLHFARMFGRSRVYQLAPEPAAGKRDKVSHDLHGRVLFGRDVTFESAESLLAEGGTIKRTSFTSEFGFDQFRARYGTPIVPLFLVTETGEWRVCTADEAVTPKPGQTLISLVRAPEAASKPKSPEAGGAAVDLSSAAAPGTAVTPSIPEAGEAGQRADRADNAH